MGLQEKTEKELEERLRESINSKKLNLDNVAIDEEWIEGIIEEYKKGNFEGEIWQYFFEIAKEDIFDSSFKKFSEMCTKICFDMNGYEESLKTPSEGAVCNEEIDILVMAGVFLGGEENTELYSRKCMIFLKNSRYFFFKDIINYLAFCYKTEQLKFDKSDSRESYIDAEKFPKWLLVIDKSNLVNKRSCQISDLGKIFLEYGEGENVNSKKLKNSGRLEILEKSEGDKGEVLNYIPEMHWNYERLMTTVKYKLHFDERIPLYEFWILENLVDVQLMEILYRAFEGRGKKERDIELEIVKKLCKCKAPAMRRYLGCAIMPWVQSLLKEPSKEAWKRLESNLERAVEKSNENFLIYTKEFCEILKRTDKEREFCSILERQAKDKMVYLDEIEYRGIAKYNSLSDMEREIQKEVKEFGQCEEVKENNVLENSEWIREYFKGVKVLMAHIKSRVRAEDVKILEEIKTDEMFFDSFEKMSRDLLRVPQEGEKFKDKNESFEFGGMYHAHFIRADQIIKTMIEFINKEQMNKESDIIGYMDFCGNGYEKFVEIFNDIENNNKEIPIPEDKIFKEIAYLVISELYNNYN